MSSHQAIIWLIDGSSLSHLAINTLRFMMTSCHANAFYIIGPLYGEPPTTCGFPPLIRTCDIFFGAGSNKLMDKQSVCWWLPTPCRPCLKTLFVVYIWFRALGVNTAQTWADRAPWINRDRQPVRVDQKCFGIDLLHKSHNARSHIPQCTIL